MSRKPHHKERLGSQREARNVRSERTEETSIQTNLANALKWAESAQKAKNSARSRADKLQKLQIETKTAELQLEEELTKALVCMPLMDVGGGCSLGIDAAMAQVVAARRQSLKGEQTAAQEVKLEAVEQERAAKESLAALEAAEFAQRRVVLKLKGRFYDEASSQRLSLADVQPRARSPDPPLSVLLPDVCSSAPSLWMRCPSGRSARAARCSTHSSGEKDGSGGRGCGGGGGDGGGGRQQWLGGGTCGGACGEGGERVEMWRYHVFKAVAQQGAQALLSFLGQALDPPCLALVLFEYQIGFIEEKTL